MIKSIYFTLLGIFTVACIFSGCQSSKIAYGNSYYFKQTPKALPAQQTADRAATPEKIASESISSKELQASIAQKVQKTEDVEAMVESAQQQLEKSGNENLKQHVARINNLKEAAKDQYLTKKEVRATRKEMRKEIKSLVKEYRKTASPNKAEGLNDLDKNLRLAIIFLGVGLILSIIYGASYVPAIGVIASIAWLVGVIFFIVWLVEELS